MWLAARGGQTLFILGITYAYIIPSRLPVFVVGPQYQQLLFYVLLKVPFEGHTKIFEKST